MKLYTARQMYETSKNPKVAFKNMDDIFRKIRDSARDGNFEATIEKIRHWQKLVLSDLGYKLTNNEEVCIISWKNI